MIWGCWWSLMSHWWRWRWCCGVNDLISQNDNDGDNDSDDDVDDDNDNDGDNDNDDDDDDDVVSPQWSCLPFWPRPHLRETRGQRFQPADSPRNHRQSLVSWCGGCDDHVNWNVDDDSQLTIPRFYSCGDWTHNLGSGPTLSNDRAWKNYVILGQGLIICHHIWGVLSLHKRGMYLILLMENNARNKFHDSSTSVEGAPWLLTRATLLALSTTITTINIIVVIINIIII